MTVHRVIVQIRRPLGPDPGQVSEGFYTVTGDELVMTHEDGEPVDPDQFRHKLRTGDNPAAIAGILTKQARRFLTGISEVEESFARPIRYSDTGIV